MKKRLIPFRLLPGSWGLTGTSYAEAEANYYLEGEELERKLIDIRYSDDPKRHKRETLNFERKHGYIDEFNYDVEIARLDGVLDDRMHLDLEYNHDLIEDYEYDVRYVTLETTEGDDRDIALLEVEYAYDRITKNDFEKRKAAIKKEPWVGIIDNGFDPREGINGVYFEFDWNDEWVQYLRVSGYNGLTDEHVVENWFADVCRSQADVPVEIINNEPVPFNSGRVINRHRRGGETEYY